MKKVTTEIFTFDELDSKAKEKARQWFRQSIGDDSSWSECVIEDAKHVFSIAGITINRVFFSGFCSQGDGACFEGGWKAEDVKPGELKKEAPGETELHRIAAGFEAVAKKYPGSTFTVKQKGHYNHENCTDFTVTTDPDLPEVQPWPEDELIELGKDAMRWIYKALESEWNYQNTDEQVDERIQANEYEFTKDGRRWVQR